jgi:endonuclease/exonuclease/phosphatase (EEP) superfamily protein YafD
MFLTLAFIGAALALAAIGAAAFSGVGHRWVDILAQFPAPAFACAVVLTVLALLLSMRRVAGLCLAVSALLAAAAWSQWFPPRASPAPGSPSMTVYSANLWARNSDVTAQVRSVAAAQADIVMLVEVGDAVTPHLDRLLASYPHRLASQVHDGANGRSRTVIASRWPLGETNFSDPVWGLEAVAQTPLGPVRLVAAHMTRPWPFQYQWGQLIHAERLAQLKGDDMRPFILAGDFNSVSTARVGTLIKNLNGAWAAPAWPGTWPSFVPGAFRVTIDQVYYSPELALTSRRLGAPTGSDHAPVITTFSRARAAPDAGRDPTSGNPPRSTPPRTP